MTFRQILHVLWKGAWLIVALVVLAAILAALFLQREEPTYTSTAVIRTNPLVAETVTTGSLGGVPVAIGTDAIMSPEVLEIAASLAGPRVRVSDLEAAVSIEVEEGEPPQYISIVATTGSAGSARLWANVVGEAYSQYITLRIDEVLVAAGEKQAAATAEAGALQAHLSRLDQLEIPQTDPVAQVKLDRELARIEEATTVVELVAAAGPPITVVSAAGPGEPLTTDPLMAYGIAISAALIAAIGLLLIRDQFNDRLRGQGEVEHLTGVTSLGALPFDRSVARGRDRLPVSSRTPTQISESLRALRASLQVLVPGRTGAAIVVTSVEPGDGKTFTSANLALAWARTGKRVILVAGDMRRPQLGDYFGEAAEGRGLADLLHDAIGSGSAPSTADLEAGLNETSFRGLRVLPAGAEPDDPADLLGSDLTGVLLDRLRELADVVVIDSPPALALADAGLIESHADGVVVLASQGRTLRGHLVATVGALETGGANILGIVVNRSRGKVPRSYTAYYTKPSRGDHDEPSDEPDEPTRPSFVPTRTSRRSTVDDTVGDADLDDLLGTGDRRRAGSDRSPARPRTGVKMPRTDTPLADS